jgi:hypothetical protein
MNISLPKQLPHPPQPRKADQNQETEETKATKPPAVMAKKVKNLHHHSGERRKMTNLEVISPDLEALTELVVGEVVGES